MIELKESLYNYDPIVDRITNLGVPMTVAEVWSLVQELAEAARERTDTECDLCGDVIPNEHTVFCSDCADKCATCEAQDE